MTWLFQPLLPGAGQQQASSATLTLAADAGSFGLSGQTAAARRAARLGATAGAFALSGQSAAPRTARRLAAQRGAFTVIGRPVGLPSDTPQACAARLHLGVAAGF